VPPISHRELKDLNAIGQGGFGVVYKAKHARLGTVVYKELNAQILGDRYLKFLHDCVHKHKKNSISLTVQQIMQ